MKKWSMCNVHAFVVKTVAANVVIIGAECACGGDARAADSTRPASPHFQARRSIMFGLGTSSLASWVEKLLHGHVRECRSRAACLDQTLFVRHPWRFET